jgi:hypothetical protein
MIIVPSRYLGVKMQKRGDGGCRDGLLQKRCNSRRRHMSTAWNAGRVHRVMWSDFPSSLVMWN